MRSADFSGPMAAVSDTGLWLPCRASGRCPLNPSLVAAAIVGADETAVAPVSDRTRSRRTGTPDPEESLAPIPMTALKHAVLTNVGLVTVQALWEQLRRKLCGSRGVRERATRGKL